MRVFVTGATGFVGFHTVMALHKAGHTIRFGVRNAEKMKKLYAKYGIDTSDSAIGEITDSEAINKALDGCDAVVHTAAVVSLDPSKADHMMQTNLTDTKLVIGGAVKKGIQSIVYVSSVAAIFDPHAQVLNEQTPLTLPRSAYGKSKRQCEEYVRGLIDAGANVAITYPSGVIGPQDPAMSECNKGLKMQFNVACVHTTSGMQIIDVRELANAHVKLLEQAKSGPYLVTGHFLPWKELSAALDRACKKTTRKITVPQKVLKWSGVALDVIGKCIPHGLPISKESAMYASQWVYCDDIKARKELGLDYRPIDDTFRDTIYWLAKSGHINRHWGDLIQPDEVDHYPEK